MKKSKENRSGGPPGPLPWQALLTLCLMASLLAGCAVLTTASSTPEAKTEGPASTPVFSEVRKPVAAGQFYPGDPEELRTMVDTLLDGVEKVEGEPIALIVPHAGYIFSGGVAAHAYKQIENVDYKAIIVIGTNHRDPGFKDVSVYAEGAFETPLGLVPIDTELAKALLAGDKRLVFNRDVHRDEHSIEVQLPFLQRVYQGKEFKIVPIIVGEPSMENCQALSEALVKALSGVKALIVASSDMSHYPGYKDACLVDTATLAAIETMNPQAVLDADREYMGRGIPNLACTLCGQGTVLTAMMTASALGANRATVLKYANSGDTPFGGRDQVVGYGAVMFWHGEGAVTPTPSPPRPLPEETPLPESMEPIHLSEAEKEKLLHMARETITSFLEAQVAPQYEVTEPNLLHPSGAFVTLKKHGNLRGCIGRLTPENPLYLTVQRVAIEAAVADSRFPPVTSDELKDIEVEISVLSPPQPIEDVSQIEVGRHGVIIVKDENQGVFLPQVAPEQGWDREKLLANLCLKANLPEDAWKEGAQLFIFTAEVFGEGKES